MTHDEIDKLEAGPEINALVADGMGKLRNKGSWYEVESPKSGWISGFHGKKDAMKWLEQQYLFSENISAAWEVVVKADLWTLRGSIGDGPMSCTLEFLDKDGTSDAPTAPLAICRAFLKARSA